MEKNEYSSLKPNLKKYEKLINSRPDLFPNNNKMEIVTDFKTLFDYENETGIKLGVVYESSLRYLLVDLIRNENGTYYTYERMVDVKNNDAVIIAPVYKGKYVFLKQFRHPLRDYQLSFPRGFGEGLLPEENAEKEIEEELGAKTVNLKFLGKVVSDSGFCGTLINAFSAEITEPKLPENYEEIENLLFLTKKEVSKMMLSGKINDALSLSVLALLENQSQ